MFDVETLNRFVYWIDERSSIHLKRFLLHQDPPWTDDPILQEWFFTNPYREWDRTTVWFKENIRDPLRESASVLMATVIFRWFNWPETGRLLMDYNLHTEWNSEHARTMLHKHRMDGNKIFTGAYIIKAGEGVSKIRGVCEAIDNLWNERERLYEAIAGGTLENAHKTLLPFPYMGKFMAYEVVTDLRWTHMLCEAPDIMTWCNPGPGCRRGFARVCGKTPGKNFPVAMCQLRELLNYCPDDFEMRDVEHSLCEFDKYERIRDGGRGKRRYP